MIIHSGGVGGGHYIAASKVDDQWVLFDDSNTSNLSDQQVKKLASCAYILYYKQN